MERPETAAAGGNALLAEGAEAQRLYRDVEGQVTLPSHVQGADAIEAVLCVLAQRLTGGEAEDVREVLPPVVRPRRCTRPHQERSELFGREIFLERVAEHLKVSAAEAEAMTRAVFAVVERWLRPKELRDVASQLPADLRQLWRSPLEAPTVVSPPLVQKPAPADRLTLKVLDVIKGSGLLPPDVTEADTFAAVMCVFCQRLSRDEARDLLVALPPGLRPLVEGCAVDRPEEAERFDGDELVHRVAEQLRVPLGLAVDLTRLVFSTAKRALPPKEIADLSSQLPADLQSLWDGLR